MSKEFVGLIDPSNAFNFVAGNVKGFYNMTQKITDKEAIARMGKQIGAQFTPEQIDEIYDLQTTEA